jgi:hypothetical protein
VGANQSGLQDRPLPANSDPACPDSRQQGQDGSRQQRDAPDLTFLIDLKINSFGSGGFFLRLAGWR